MTTVHKYSIHLDNLNDVVELDMPVGAQVVSVGNQNEILCFWAVVNPDTTKRELRRFRVAGTGHPLEVGIPIGRFLGTVLFMDGRLVLHVFDDLSYKAGKKTY